MVSFRIICIFLLVFEFLSAHHHTLSMSSSAYYTNPERMTPETSISRRVWKVSIFFAAFQILLLPQGSAAFCSQPALRSTKPPRSALFAVPGPDDEITKQLERAKDLLAKSKAKIQAKEAAALEYDAGNSPIANAKLPFFAAALPKKNGNKRDRVIKSKNRDGLFTTDGDLMAKLSEAEEWEVRTLLEVFENENKDALDKNTLADRDVAASIFGLQKVLQTEDFQKIFDERNRFIGEQ